MALYQENIKDGKSISHIKLDNNNNEYTIFEYEGDINIIGIIEKETYSHVIKIAYGNPPIIIEEGTKLGYMIEEGIIKLIVDVEARLEQARLEQARLDTIYNTEDDLHNKSINFEYDFNISDIETTTICPRNEMAFQTADTCNIIFHTDPKNPRLFFVAV